MANVTPDKIRAFCAPRKQNLDSIWEDETTATQQGARSGVPIASQSSGLVLQTTGTMGDGEHIEILTQRGGHASAAGNARFVWRANTTGDYYGRNTGNVIDYWQYVNGTVTFDYLPRDCMGTSDGFAFVLCQRAQSGTNSIAIIKRERDGTYNAPTVIKSNITTLRDVFGCMTQLSDGSILAAYTVYDNTAGLCNINVHRSIDDGATWSQVATNALKIDIPTSAATSDYTIAKMVMAYNKGQILLLIEATKNLTTTAGRNKILQYVSVDEGGSFDFIAEVGDTYTDYFAAPSLVVHQGIFVVSVIYSASVAWSYRLSNAYVPLDITVNNALLRHEIYNSVSASSGEIATITSNAAVGYASMWRDDDDTLWHIFQQQESGAALEKYNFIMQSVDGGITWQRMGQDTSATNDFVDDAIFWGIDTTNIELNRCMGCSVGGTQLVFHNWINTTTTTYNDYLGVIHLGGYSSVTMPPLNELSGDVSRAGFASTYLPLTLPDNVGYTASGGGTATINGQYLNITTTANDKGYQINIANDLAAGAIIRATLQVVDGVGANDVLIALRISNGTTTDYYVSLRGDPNGFTLYDQNATSALATVAYNLTQKTEFIIALANGDVAAWYRTVDPLPKQWSTIHQGTATSGTATQAIAGFGNITTSTKDTRWFEFHYCDDIRTGLQLAFGQQNPQEIWARPYPPINQYTQLTGGLSITTSDGPTYEGDEWTIQTAYDYPIQNIFYAVSPSTRSPWRSQNAGGLVPAQRIAWFVDDTAQDMTLMSNDILCITLQNINFAEFEIQRHNGTTWSTVETFDNKIVTTFERHGASIKSTSTASGYEYLFYNECQDWYVRLTDEATTKVRKVRTNSEGIFGAPSGINTKYAVLQLDGIDGTEPTSGTCELIPNRCTVVLNLRGAANAREAKAFAINITQQYTHEQYFIIGNMAFGELVIPGRQYSRGRTITFEAGVLQNQRNDGTLYTRDTGNSGRRVRLAWVDGVDVSQLYDFDTTPDYWQGTTSAGGEAIAVLDDVPDLMIGLIRYLNGTQNPLVYLPYIDKSTGSDDYQIFNRYSNHMFCVLDSDIQLENILGDEGNNRTTATQGELLRVATINLREIR